MKNPFWLAVWLSSDKNLVVKTQTEYLSEPTSMVHWFILNWWANSQYSSFIEKQRLLRNWIFNEKENYCDFESWEHKTSLWDRYWFQYCFGLSRAVLSTYNSFWSCQRGPLPISPKICAVLLKSGKDWRTFYDIIVQPFVT